jgi:hypothetical protein
MVHPPIAGGWATLIVAGWARDFGRRDGRFDPFGVIRMRDAPAVRLEWRRP